MATRTSDHPDVVFLSSRRLDRIQAADIEVATSQAQVLKTLQRERTLTVWVVPNALPPQELADALKATHSADLCIGGFIDKKAGIVTLIRGNLQSLVVPLDSFEPTPGDGERPDFSRFSVRDSGQTVAFGDYEASFDAVLYEQDKEYRHRKKQENLKTDASLGGSIRRLRKQRRLSRAAFPDVPERTLARIETGEVAHPRQETLRLIAKTLRVPVDALDSY